MEPLHHPIWRKRVRCLAGLLEEPMALVSIQNAAHQAWGWSHWFTSNVVCAGEGGVLRARLVKGKWLYGRVPGLYEVSTADYGRELRRVVASTVPPKKRRKKVKPATYHARSP